MTTLKALATVYRIANRGCATCLRDGVSRLYLVERGGAFARARRCPECAGPCEECEDGYVYAQTPWGGLVSTECRCRSIDKRIRQFNKAGVPWPYAGATLETFRAQTALQGVVSARVKEWALGYVPDARGIALSGPPGCGKTHLLCAVVQRLTLETGQPARYVDFPWMLDAIKAGLDRDQSVEASIAPYVAVPVLAIDEVGQGLSTTWQEEVFDTLISRRYNAGRTTMIATNFVFSDGGQERSRGEHFRVVGLEDRVGARIFSRLNEMCELLPLDGPDYRRRPR